MMTIPELDEYITKHIQGVFSQSDMAVLKEEIEKLKYGEIYVEMGVNEGKSARVSHEYAANGVYKIWIDIWDVTPHSASVGRAPWMEKEGMVGLGKKGFYVHGDGDLFANLICALPEVSLLFLDPYHDYESIKSATLAWEPRVKKGGVILFHDYDHPETKKWIDEHYPPSKIEVLHGKIVRVKI